MIKLGPAGNCDKDILSSIKRLPELGLNAQEVEFTHGIQMKNEIARKAGELAKEKNIQLSVHCPYYINLLSEEKEKREASKKRILMSAERAHYLGAKNVVFHSGYFGKLGKKEAFEIVKNEIEEMNEVIKENKWNVMLCPETAGKFSQFTDTPTLLELSREINCRICVDFAHIKACNNGKIDYAEVLDMLKNIKEIHSHYSGVTFTEKGERSHIAIDEMDFEQLAKELLKRKTNITIICESPLTWKDSMKMKEIIEKIFP